MELRILRTEVYPYETGRSQGGALQPQVRLQHGQPLHDQGRVLRVSQGSRTAEHELTLCPCGLIQRLPDLR